MDNDRKDNHKNIITVDCREMEPPEPMIKVLEAVSNMGDDEAVLMLHRQKPVHLFSRLDAMGLDYSLTEKDDMSVEVLIWSAKKHV